MTRFQDVLPFRSRWPALAVGAASVLWLTAPTPAHAVSAPVIQAHEGLTDFDSRTGFLLPTRAQLDAVGALGATVRWNAFGTPASLLRHDGFLGSAPGADAGTAAREWVRAHRELFRLSDADVTSLELVNAAKLAGSTGRAVLFRQRFGLLPSAQDGMITVGLVDGKVAYVSSSAVGSQAAPAPAVLSAAQAWLAAAGNVGRVLSLVNLTGLRLENGWTVFSAAGLTQPQRARLVAFPTPTLGVKAAYETIVLDVRGGHAEACTSFVDARTGEVLFRQNRVQNLAQPDTFDVDTQPLAGGPRWNWQRGRHRRGVAQPAHPGRAVPPGEPAARLLLPVDEPVEHEQVLAAGVPLPAAQRRGRGHREPLRDAQPHARLELLPRLHRAELQPPAVQLRQPQHRRAASDGRRAGPGGGQRPGGRADGRLPHLARP